MMIRLAILLTSATTNASTIQAAASPCVSASDIAATRTHWAAIHGRFSKTTDHDAACRAYAALFYELVTTRQAAAGCNGDVGALDSEINAFNDLIETRCGG